MMRPSAFKIALFLWLAVANICSANLRCEKILAALYQKVARFYSFTTNADNEAHLKRLTAKSNQVDSILHIDSANKKWQNDYGMQSKEVVDAAENLFRKKFQEALENDDFLFPYLLSKYSDFKTMRLAFKAVPAFAKPAFDTRLKALFEKVNESFAKDLGPSLQELAPDISHRIETAPKTRLDSQIASWHTAGFAQKNGVSNPVVIADLAGLRARFAREDFGQRTDKNVIPIRTNDAKIAETLKRIWEHHDAVSLKNLPKGLVEIEDGVALPSYELLDIFRKAPSFSSEGVQPNTAFERYLAYIKTQMKEANLPELSNEEIIQLRDLSSLSDKFSPSINSTGGERPTFEGQPISVDIKGVGALNLQKLIKHLVKMDRTRTHEDLVLDAVNAARESEKEATEWVDRQRDTVQTAARLSKLVDSASQVRFSGDDMTITCSEKDLNSEKFKKFLALLHAKSPGQFRVAVPERQMKGWNHSKELSDLEKSEVAVQLEILEKSIRKEFKSNDVDLAFSAISTPLGFEVTGFITGKKVSPELKTKVEDVAKRSLQGMGLNYQLKELVINPAKPN